MNDKGTQFIITDAGDNLSTTDLQNSVLIKNAAKSSSSLHSIPPVEDRDVYEIQRSSSHSEGFYRSKASKSSLKATSGENDIILHKRSPKEMRKAFVKSTPTSGSRTSLSPSSESGDSNPPGHRKRSVHNVLNRSDLGPRFTEKEEKEKEKKKKDKRRSWFHQD